jgi:hypothetical protein
MKKITINGIIRAAGRTPASLRARLGELLSSAFLRAGNADPADFYSAFGCDPLDTTRLEGLNEEEKMLLYHELISFLYDINGRQKVTRDTETALALLCCDKPFAGAVLKSLAAGIELAGEGVKEEKATGIQPVTWRQSILEMIDLIRSMSNAMEMVETSSDDDKSGDRRAQKMAQRIAKNLSMAEFEKAQFEKTILRYRNSLSTKSLALFDIKLKAVGTKGIAVTEKEHLRQEIRNLLSKYS